jgi:hypothetical protein
MCGKLLTTPRNKIRATNHPVMLSFVLSIWVTDSS